MCGDTAAKQKMVCLKRFKMFGKFFACRLHSDRMSSLRLRSVRRSRSYPNLHYKTENRTGDYLKQLEAEDSTTEIPKKGIGNTQDTKLKPVSKSNFP